MLRVSLVEVFLGVALLFLQGFLPRSFPLPSIEDVLPQSVTREEAVVQKVIDGDTLTVLLNGRLEKVRLIGIDTPETVDKRQEVECFGKEASDMMRSLVLKKIVLLENDSTQNDRDRYQRLLRYVFLPDGVFVNKVMIQEGFAFEYTYSSPYRYQQEFINAEKKAKREEKGLWNRNAC